MHWINTIQVHSETRIFNFQIEHVCFHTCIWRDHRYLCTKQKVFWSIYFFANFCWKKEINRAISQFGLSDWIKQTQYFRAVDWFFLSIDYYFKQVSFMRSKFSNISMKYIYSNLYNSYHYINHHYRQRKANMSVSVCVFYHCNVKNGILPFIKSQIDVKHVQYCHQR